MRARRVIGSSQEHLNGEIRTSDWNEEITVKTFKLKHSSRVCRRTCSSLLTIPENDEIDLKKFVRSPVLNMRPGSRPKLTPALKSTSSASAAMRSVDSKTPQGEKSRKQGFWKALKLKPSTNRKTKNHHVDATSLLSFV
ncbi:hypothetical protein GE061_002995 [Apolygus lucorum]|uniref:Uncharacterized protein n=1 Tax=Apolygus lucorum TaxID=248454 RepID=A0A6A4JQZ8_APOLU|nr:hypothetical protein GE061_002995 [Apolygus lucorum]